MLIREIEIQYNERIQRYEGYVKEKVEGEIARLMQENDKILS